MRLAEFILGNAEPILVEWEAFARSLPPGMDLSPALLRDDAEWILLATARDMCEHQTIQQRESKSKGDGGAAGEVSDRLDNASDAHGGERVSAGFRLADIVAEYRALRASVLRLWRQSLPAPDLRDLDDITRFNEALDQSIARSVGSYSKRIEKSGNMFLAILAHDLRTPLSAIQMATQVVSLNHSDPATANAVSVIERNTDAMMQLIADLIDFASSGLGRLLPLHRGPVDLEKLCLEVIDSYRTLHPGRTLCFRSVGDATGVWDAGRVRQIVSNLVGNAIQHGSPESSVDLSVTSEGRPSPGFGSLKPTVVLTVHNGGEPIPPALLPTIFEPLKRYQPQKGATQRTPGSIGLGLYIVREIVKAKGGTVTVRSTAEEGTTLTVRIPRVLPIEGMAAL